MLRVQTAIKRVLKSWRAERVFTEGALGEIESALGVVDDMMMAADGGEDAAPALPDFEVMAQPPAGRALSPPAAAHPQTDVWAAAALPPPALLPAPECAAGSLTCDLLPRSRMGDRIYTSAPFCFGAFAIIHIEAVFPSPSHPFTAIDMAGTTHCPPCRCRRLRSCYPCPQHCLALRTATTENLTQRRPRLTGAHRPPVRRRSRWL